MMRGAFIDFPLIYADGVNHGLTNGQQAQTILTAARILLSQGYPIVAILYSANASQTANIEEAYAEGKYSAGIYGANQAQVMNALEDKLGTDSRDLQLKMRIAPITTIPDPQMDHPTAVAADLARIEVQLNNGWALLGWQNQLTVLSKEHPYAIGGGIQKLDPVIDSTIQSRLKGFKAEYGALRQSLPHPWPPTVS
jgi:hypothetical protein